MTSEDEKLEPGHYTDRAQRPTLEKWDAGVSVKTLLTVVAVVAGLALVLIAVAMIRTAISSGGPGAGANNSRYDILQRRVDEAFSTGGANNVTSPSGTPQTAVRNEEIETPEELEAERLRDQQELLQQQEELREQQREMVPSVLPENVPTPAPLNQPY